MFISDASPYIEHSALLKNRALRGGAIYWEKSRVRMKRITVSDNFAQWGGGLYFNECDVLLENSLISDNSAEYGGGILGGGSQSMLVNVTMVGNEASSFSGAISLIGRNRLECRNSIVWTNRSPYRSSLGVSHADTVYFFYSDIDSLNRRWINWSYPDCGVVIWHEGNISADPLFCDSLGVNFALQPNSPCIDTGDPRPFFEDFENSELPGVARWPAGGSCRNDMGVYGGGVYLLSKQGSGKTPVEYYLSQNYPNPFNRSTTIVYQIPQTGHVSVNIYNIMGQLVRTVVDAEIRAGCHKTVWNGDNSHGQPVASGLYFCRMLAGNYERWRKLVLTR